MKFRRTSSTKDAVKDYIAPKNALYSHLLSADYIWHKVAAFSGGRTHYTLHLVGEMTCISVTRIVSLLYALLFYVFFSTTEPNSIMQRSNSSKKNEILAKLD